MNFLQILCLFAIVGGASYRFVREVNNGKSPAKMLWYGFEIIALASVFQYFA